MISEEGKVWRAVERVPPPPHFHAWAGAPRVPVLGLPLADVARQVGVSSSGVAKLLRRAEKSFHWVSNVPLPPLATSPTPYPVVPGWRGRAGSRPRRSPAGGGAGLSPRRLPSDLRCPITFRTQHTVQRHSIPAIVPHAPRGPLERPDCLPIPLVTNPAAHQRC